MTIDCSDEMLTYLHSKIDPRDRLNPKYALLWQQIDAINSAKSIILAAQRTKLIFFSVGEFSGITLVKP